MQGRPKRTADTGTTDEGTAATSSGVPQPAAAETTEGRRGWKQENQEPQEEKRAARNRAASPPGRGPRNALTHNVADAIWEDMRRWYEERLDGGDVSVGWKHLQQCLVDNGHCAVKR